MDKRNILISEETCPSRMNSNNKYYNRVYVWLEDYGYNFGGEFTDMQAQKDFLSKYAKENGLRLEDLSIEIRKFNQKYDTMMAALEQKLNRLMIEEKDLSNKLRKTVAKRRELAAELNKLDWELSKK